MAKRAAVLLSGGMDSVTLLHHVVKDLGHDEVYAISFDYGQKHSKELACARFHCEHLPEVKEHQVLDISFMGQILGDSTALVKAGEAVPALEDLANDKLDQPITYVPNRNMMLLSIASSFTEGRNCSKLFYGAQAQDEYGYWDCTEDFLNNINSVLQLNRRTPVEICAPFVHSRKADIVTIGTRLDIAYEQTWTCYRGGEKSCHVCPSCVEREKAFIEAGLIDPLA